MRIGVNAKFLTEPYTGIHSYLVGLLRALAEVDRGNQYFLVVPEEVDFDFGENFELVVVKERGRGSAGMKKTWWEQIQVPEIFVSMGVEVAFFPYVAAPWGKDFYQKFRTVMTVHDVIPWVRKGYRKRFLSRMYHAQSKKTLKRVDRLVTVSEASKEAIVEECGIDGDRVSVVYNDASEIFKKGTKDVKSVISEWGLKEGEYFVYCGGYDERKNVRKLVERFLSSTGDTKLVLVGDKLFNSDLYQSFDGMEDERIVKTGFVEEGQLVALYAGAIALSHFSQEEGFNLPILEAANSGTALLLSDIPVHREIAGDAAMFVDIGNDKNMTEAFGKMAKEREQWLEKAEKLTEKYSWKKSAKIMLEIFNKK